jgi:hypothetical protein
VPGRVDLLRYALLFNLQSGTQMALRFTEFPPGLLKRQIQLLRQRGDYYQQYGKMYGFSPLTHLHYIPYGLEHAAAI